MKNQKMMKLRRQGIRKDRVWKHFLHWLPEQKFQSNLRKWEGKYDPEDHRFHFERYQTHGARGMTLAQLEGIKPLQDGQKLKEITLNMLVEECYDSWSMGCGWLPPIVHYLSEPTDRLTKVAILKIKRRIKKDKFKFLVSFTGISEDKKQRILGIFLGYSTKYVD